MASKEVAEHYNGVRQEGIGGRTESRIFYQRNLSNWIKSQLIDEVMSCLRKENVYNPRVMDLACGKGGDLKKWKIARTKSAVMVDVAAVSINQARDRYEENRQREGDGGWFPVKFIVADCCAVDIKKEIDDPRPFDIVSCQFALHYSFINESSARTFLRNATESLRPGGYFIGTLPDAERIVWAGRQHDGEFVNEVCKVRFENKDELEKPPLFGCKFHFTLDSQVNCPEFLAYFPLLEHLLNEMDMELVLMKRFPDAIRHWQEKGRGLMGKMQALEPFPASEGSKLAGADADYELAQEFVNKLDPEERNRHVGTLSRAEWEAVCMYLVFIFRKRGGEIENKEEVTRKRAAEVEEKYEGALKRRVEAKEEPAETVPEDEPTEKRIRIEEPQ